MCSSQSVHSWVHVYTQNESWHEHQRYSRVHSGFYCIASRPFARFVCNFELVHLNYFMWNNLLELSIDILQLIYFKWSTWCKIVSDKKYLLPIQARKHGMGCASCLFSQYNGAFWYNVSKKIYNCWLIIHFKRFEGA